MSLIQVALILTFPLWRFTSGCPSYPLISMVTCLWNLPGVQNAELKSRWTCEEGQQDHCVFSERHLALHPCCHHGGRDKAQLKPRVTDLQHENNELSATRLWGWKHEGSHKRSGSLKNVLILCRTFITQFQDVKVRNVGGIIGWGVLHPVICQLDGEAGLQLVAEPWAEPWDSGSFICLFFIFESHAYKIRFLSWNEKVIIERKTDGIQSIFSSQNEIF